MNEEEKFAISYINNCYEFAKMSNRNLFPDWHYEQFKMLLNLINKQQKEIESYKERYENMKWYFDNQENNLIYKNKIKEKIEDLKKYKKEIEDEHDEEYYYTLRCIKVLKELLGE